MEMRLAANQIELSLVAPQGFSNGDVAFLQERGLPVMAWSPLGGGSLTGGSGELAALLRRLGEESGTDALAVAVAWLLAHPAQILPVMGTNNLNRIHGLSRALEVPIDRQTWFKLYTAALGGEVP